MKHTTKEIELCEDIFANFYECGSIATGGVTRLGYTEVEDEMHNILRTWADHEGFHWFEDEVGNTFVDNGADNEDITLIGSHLDSVIDGGRYDGVSGIIAGMLVCSWIREQELNIHVRIAAFRCEESSNFGQCTIGSGLICHEIYKKDIGGLTGKDGMLLEKVFEKYGYSLSPKKIDGYKEYLEVHIEQGKVLEEMGLEIGVVTNIAGPKRFRITMIGLAEHSGATPMGMRSDALAASAEVILEVEKIGQREAIYHSVATVGVVDVLPNALNVIPGEVKLGIDIRGIDTESLDRMEIDIRDACRKVCKQRNLTYYREKITDIKPIAMDEVLVNNLSKTCDHLGIRHKLMMSGAGHDAMSFAPLFPSAMLFIPCHKGISHNKKEFAHIESILDSAKVLFHYLKAGETV